jgi:hypothetical protein
MTRANHALKPSLTSGANGGDGSTVIVAAVEARPPSFWYRLRKMARRNKVVKAEWTELTLSQMLGDNTVICAFVGTIVLVFLVLAFL